MRKPHDFREGKRERVKLGEGKMAEASLEDPEALTLHFLLLFGFCLTYSRPVAECLRDASCPDHHDSSETLQVVLCCSVCNLSLLEEEHWYYSSGI